MSDEQQKEISPQEAVELAQAAKLLARDVLLQCFRTITDEPGQVALACALAEDSMAFVASKTGARAAYVLFSRLLEQLDQRAKEEAGLPHKPPPV